VNPAKGIQKLWNVYCGTINLSLIASSIWQFGKCVSQKGITQQLNKPTRVPSSIDQIWQMHITISKLWDEQGTLLVCM